MNLFETIVPKPLSIPDTSWQKNRLRFSLFAPNVEKIEYFFYSAPWDLNVGKEMPLLQKVVLEKETFQFGETWAWQADVVSPASELSYLIRIWKKDETTSELKSQWIFDPHAKENSGGEIWGKSVRFRVNPLNEALQKLKSNTKVSADQVRRLSVIRPQGMVEERAKRPGHPIEKVIIYECHVRGMTHTAQSDLSDPGLAGTYQGLIEKIPYFKELGVTAIELLPVFDFDETENRTLSPKTGEKLVNYWGYSPLSFFALKQGYAHDPSNALGEFKAMIDAFHEADLEVWLDVVYNHTAELDEGGPIDHFKALGQTTWYSHNPDGQLHNYSGCGNTLNASHGVVKNMIVASLRYWANEVGVDGFRFDLTTILDRDSSGAINDFPHLLWEIRHDPQLEATKLIAEPWDAGGGYQVGHLAYHSQMMEWNDQFRDSIRKVMKGEQGHAEKLRNALMGSPEIYQSPERARQFSVNFITAHDGMTLWDLVSYNGKHNLENGEHNRDGSNDNHSYNCGHEGPSKDSQILKVRNRKMRTFYMLLVLAKGIPMILAGDEFAKTQSGNNNPYCLDTPVNWMDWKLLKKNRHLFDFLKGTIAFRNQYYSFLFSEESTHQWYNSVGEPEDLSHHIRSTMCLISNKQWPGEEMCFMVNCFEENLDFRFPMAGEWKSVLDSSGGRSDRFIFSDTHVVVPRFSMRVFQKTKSAC